MDAASHQSVYLQHRKPHVNAASQALNFASTCLRLRGDATVEQLPIDDSFWQRLMGGQLGGFHKEFLITRIAFDADWSSWEMHPSGDEIVCLLSGAVTFLLEGGSGIHPHSLTAVDDYLVVPKGTWHTAKTQRSSRMLFITPGEGTQHRPTK